MSAAAAGASVPRGEEALALRWAAGARGLRLEDGRRLHVVFPGVRGGASGPDFTGAIVEAGGDLLRGDIELHLRASGWRSHGHAHDPAYAGVVLHVVGENDTGSAATLHASGRAIPIAVLRAAPGALGAFPPPFVPPCALETARGRDPGPALARLGLRRLRAKAARAVPLVASAGAGQALYALLLETLAGAANREAFATLAQRLPLAALLDAPDGPGRPSALAAALKDAGSPLQLRRAGLRPASTPERRLAAAGALVDALWPAGAATAWPPGLPPGKGPGPLRVSGVGAGTAVELMLNAVLPVALAATAWPDEAIEATFAALPSPGTYGRLRPLEGWLTGCATPFRGARELQGGLLLARDYCAAGRCGRCPLSSTTAE